MSLLSNPYEGGFIKFSMTRDSKSPSCNLNESFFSDVFIGAADIGLDTPIPEKIPINIVLRLKLMSELLIGEIKSDRCVRSSFNE